MSGGSGLCRFCLLLLFAIAFLALFFYLTYRPIKPRYYLTAFSLLSNSSSLVVASFELTISNRNKELGVYYDDLNLSLSTPFSNSSSSSPNSATAVVPGFYQGHERTAFKGGFFTSSNSSAGRWKAAAGNGSDVLRVAVESEIRYKAVAWTGRRHRVSVAAEVAVDREGNKSAEDRIRLRTAASPVHNNGPLRHSIVAVVFAVYALMRC